MKLQKTDVIIVNVKKKFSFPEYILCRRTSNLQSVTWFSMQHVQNILFYPRKNVTTDDQTASGG